MDKEHVLRILLQRILAPSYLGTVLWVATDYFELAIGGFAVSVLFALAYPFLAVSQEALFGYHLQRQGARRAQLLKTFLPFLNAYVHVLTKYPPGILLEAQNAAATQIALLAAHLRPLKERRLPQTADPYELVQAGSLAPRDFASWRLSDFQTWKQQVLDDLSTGDILALKDAAGYFLQHPTGRLWEALLAEAERDFDRQATQTLQGWRCVQQAQQDQAIQQRLQTLLRLDAINRQAGLQTYLAGRPFFCTPAEIRTMMASLRYESVAVQLRTLFEAS